jgi:hypothetical protein
VREFYLRQVHADPAKVDVIYNAVDWSQLETTVSATRCAPRSGCRPRRRWPASSRGLTEQRHIGISSMRCATTPELNALHLLVVGDGDLRE